jgi:prepilin-type N-terminal cleavage/methylation domain-containing protein
MRTPRAFTLMEVAVTMAIAGFVSVAALSLHVAVSQSFSVTRRVAELSDRLLATSTYLAREFTTIGGNTASASMSVFIENNCTARGGYPACPNGSDRITMFAAVPRTPACRVSHVDNNVSPPRFAFWFRDESGEPRCCLNDELNGERTPGSKTQYLKRHLMLSQGPFHKPVLLIAEHGAPGFTTVPAPAVYTSTDLDGDGDIDSRCTFRAIEVVPSVQRTEPPLVTDWVDASASIVDMRTIFIDSREAGAPPKLVLHTDKDENGGGAFPTTTNAGTTPGPWQWSDIVSPPEDETLLIVDGVYDLQLALGYDLNDDDNVSATEWVHDVPGELRNFADDRRLRLLRFDLVMGIPVSAGAQAERVVPTPARDGGNTLVVPNVALRTTSITLQPRNGDALLAGLD